MGKSTPCLVIPGWSNESNSNNELTNDTQLRRDAPQYTDFKKMLPMNKAKWKCPACKQAKKGATTISPRLTAAASSCAALESTQPQLQLQQDGSMKSIINYFDDRFNNLLATVESFKCSVTEELRNLSEAVNTWSSKISHIESSVNCLTERMNDFDQELSKLNNYCTEVDDLKLKIKELSENSIRSDQWVRRSNIQINGVPYKKGENLIQIVKTLASKSNFPINVDTDVDFVTRVAVKNDTTDSKPRPIILKMQARYKKDDFLSSIRKLKGLLATDIGFTGINNPIYVNDHLSTYNKALLNNARRRSKEKGYMYCWVRNCTVMVRKTHNSPVIHISSNDCLKKIS